MKPARDVAPTPLFGFSWPVAISLRKPRKTAIGFSWIFLDFLVRIETYQWVTRDSRWKIFRTSFDRSKRQIRRLRSEEQDCSSDEFNLPSVFLQQIIGPARSLSDFSIRGPLQPHRTIDKRTSSAPFIVRVSARPGPPGAMVK